MGAHVLPKLALAFCGEVSYRGNGNSGNKFSGAKGPERPTEQKESFRPIRNTGDRVSYEEVLASVLIPTLSAKY